MLVKDIYKVWNLNQDNDIWEYVVSDKYFCNIIKESDGYHLHIYTPYGNEYLGPYKSIYLDTIKLLAEDKLKILWRKFNV